LFGGDLPFVPIYITAYTIYTHHAHLPSAVVRLIYLARSRLRTRLHAFSTRSPPRSFLPPTATLRSPPHVPCPTRSTPRFFGYHRAFATACGCVLPYRYRLVPVTFTVGYCVCHTDLPTRCYVTSFTVLPVASFASALTFTCRTFPCTRFAVGSARYGSPRTHFLRFTPRMDHFTLTFAFPAAFPYVYTTRIHFRSFHGWFLRPARTLRSTLLPAAFTAVAVHAHGYATLAFRLVYCLCHTVPRFPVATVRSYLRSLYGYIRLAVPTGFGYTTFTIPCPYARSPTAYLVCVVLFTFTAAARSHVPHLPSRVYGYPHLILHFFTLCFILFPFYVTHVVTFVTFPFVPVVVAATFTRLFTRSLYLLLRCSTVVVDLRYICTRFLRLLPGYGSLRLVTLLVHPRLRSSPLRSVLGYGYFRRYISTRFRYVGFYIWDSRSPFILRFFFYVLQLGYHCCAFTLRCAHTVFTCTSLCWLRLSRVTTSVHGFSYSSLRSALFGSHCRPPPAAPRRTTDFLVTRFCYTPLLLRAVAVRAAAAVKHRSSAPRVHDHIAVL